MSFLTCSACCSCRAPGAACKLCPSHSIGNRCPIALPTTARCRLEGCDDFLLHARLLHDSHSGGGGGGSGGDGGGQAAAWVRKGGKAVEQTLLQAARAGGARALEELRVAATAGSFTEVLRVLGAVEEEAVQQPWSPAAAPGGAPSAAPTPSAAPERAPQAAAAALAAEPAVADAPPRREAGAARAACAAGGAANAPLKCGACGAVRYCGAECQRRDWGAHKTACKQLRRR